VRTRKLSALSLLVVLALLSTLGRLGIAEDGPAVGVHPGQKAPEFSLPLLDGDDEKLSLYEQVSKYDVVVLCFFIVSN